MPPSWFDAVRHAREEQEQAEHVWEEYVSSVQDAWEDVTTLPTVVTVMGSPFTFDSTGMPPWLSTADLPDAFQTGFPTQTPNTQQADATSVGMTQSTTVAVGGSAAATSPQAGAAATDGASAPASAPASASGTDAASPSESTLCTTPSGPDGYSDGAAVQPTGIGGGSYPESNGGVTDPSGPNNGGDSSGGGPPLGLILAAVIIPVLVISLLAFTVFIVLRRRKQRKAAAQASASEEMKLRLTDDLPPPGPPPGSPPVPSREATPQAPPRAVTPASPPPPVIVSAINPASNSSYFTGIDTSEALSVRTNSVRSGPRTAGFMLDGEFHEEPPPPYRPRSVPPISRDSSMRTNNCGDYANTRLMADESRPTNPFADPSDDDDDSIISGIGPYARRADDHLSVVSDLSYQNEPTIVHQAV